MIVVVLDACFLILLRDTERLDLLGKAAGPLSWEYYAPETVYLESTARRPDGEAVERLVSDGTIHRCTAPDALCSELRLSYPSLARGEVEAIAFALTEKDHREEVLVVSDDRRARNVACELGLDVLGVLDFIGDCHGVGVMSGEEVRGCLPLLRRHFELSDEKVREFLVLLGLN